MSRAFFLFCLGALPLCAAPSSTNCRPANSFEQGREITKSQMPAAYNAAARIKTRGSFDLYVTADYLFWQPLQDNLELCIENENAAILPLNGKIKKMDFKYKSGFKAGLGLSSDCDNWDAYGQYTWFGGRHSAHAAASVDKNKNVTGNLLPLWGTIDNLLIPTADGMWRLRLQFVDANLGRSYYVGTNLTFRPYFGLRSAWINQKYKATYHLNANASFQVRETTRSWGIGPEAGLLTHWILGGGFRLIGSVETDLLYTNYKLRIKEQNPANPEQLLIDLKERPYTVRPHADFQLGIGWGSYFSNHNYHCDFSATYGFQVFWDQNMFRTFGGAFRGNTSVPNGNLYLQGLTVEARFDF